MNKVMGRAAKESTHSMAGGGSSVHIVMPPKLYLDTCHLINIARLRNRQPLQEERYRPAYQFISKCILDLRFGLIFNMQAPLEWADGRATLDTAMEIAAVVDDSPLKYLYEGDTFLWTSELLEECSRVSDVVRVPKLPKLQPVERGGTVQSTVGILTGLVPEYIEAMGTPPAPDGPDVPAACPVFTAKEAVAQTFNRKKYQPDLFQERLDGYRASFNDDVKAYSEGAKLDRLAMIGWTKRFLKIDLVLDTLNPGCDVDGILDRVDIDRCPAVKLWFGMREHRIKAGHTPKDNEVDDWMILAVVPYADVVLVDRGFRDSLLRADRTLESKVFADPNEAWTALESWC